MFKGGDYMKLFVVSDIHSYYDIFMKSLHKAGFEDNNPTHLLICCGDYFDRGDKPVDVMQYLMSLQNVILIKGNHEYLMEDLLERKCFLEHDIHNGTSQTFCILADKVDPKNKISNPSDIVSEFIKPFYAKMIPYYETKNYVFVHGFIPVEKLGEIYRYKLDWRNSSQHEFEQSTWTNGISMVLDNNIRVPDKTLVCGHYHCSYGYLKTGKAFHDFGSTAIWEPFKTDGLIAIDRCTAYTQEMNILVIEDELLA